jgi:SNF2-related domain
MYQMTKLPWKGGIVGNDAGTGKTGTSIAFIYLLSRQIQQKPAEFGLESYHPWLVVAPANLVTNWVNEFDKFTKGRLQVAVWNSMMPKADNPAFSRATWLKSSIYHVERYLDEIPASDLGNLNRVLVISYTTSIKRAFKTWSAEVGLPAKNTTLSKHLVAAGILKPSEIGSAPVETAPDEPNGSTEADSDLNQNIQQDGDEQNPAEGDDDEELDTSQFPASSENDDDDPDDETEEVYGDHEEVPVDQIPSVGQKHFTAKYKPDEKNQYRTVGTVPGTHGFKYLHFRGPRDKINPTRFLPGKFQAWTLRNFRFTGMICDEAHALKNPQSLNSSAFSAIDCQYRLFLTATPLLNAVTDLQGYLQQFYNPDWHIAVKPLFYKVKNDTNPNRWKKFYDADFNPRTLVRGKWMLVEQPTVLKEISPAQTALIHSFDQLGPGTMGPCRTHFMYPYAFKRFHEQYNNNKDPTAFARTVVYPIMRQFFTTRTMETVFDDGKAQFTIGAGIPPRTMHYVRLRFQSQQETDSIAKFEDYGCQHLIVNDPTQADPSRARHDVLFTTQQDTNMLRRLQMAPFLPTTIALTENPTAELRKRHEKLYRELQGVGIDALVGYSAKEIRAWKKEKKDAKQKISDLKRDETVAVAASEVAQLGRLDTFKGLRIYNLITTKNRGDTGPGDWGRAINYILDASPKMQWILAKTWEIIQQSTEDETFKVLIFLVNPLPIR